jgi:hypothetical protein
MYYDKLGDHINLVESSPSSQRAACMSGENQRSNFGRRKASSCVYPRQSKEDTIAIFISRLSMLGESVIAQVVARHEKSIEMAKSSLVSSQ